MKKIIYIYIFVILMFVLIFFSLLRLQNTGTAYNLSELNDFLDDLEDEYHYIEKSNVVERHGTICIDVFYVGHPELEFDEDIYDKFRIFFMQTNIQERIIEKESYWPVKGVSYPYIKVDFTDTVGTESHYIESPTSLMEASRKDNFYSEWTEPKYYVPHVK